MKINNLKLYSSNLSEQIAFYTETIGLNLIESSESEAVIKAGNSMLTLIKSDRFQPYHFAFNIPCNKEVEALEWLKARLQILKDGDSEIQDFQSWNAKAIYFYDQDRNIVELIARKNLNNHNTHLFNGDSILEISEIGLPVNNIEDIYNNINKITGMNIYSGTLDRFCAIGDENGLFICINKQLKNWFPTGDIAYSSDFEINFTEKGSNYTLELINGKINKRYQ